MHTAKMDFSQAKDSSAKNLFEKLSQKYPIGTFQKGTPPESLHGEELLAAMSNGAQSQRTSSESEKLRTHL